MNLWKSVKNVLLKVLGSMVIYIFFGCVYILTAKKLISESPFNYPVLLTCINNWVLFFILSFYVLSKYGNSVDLNEFISWKFLVIGALSGLDNAFSNLAFSHVSVLVYTIIKSTSPLFIMVLSFYFKLEKVNVFLIASILMIVVGVSISGFKSLYDSENKSSSVLGIVYVICAAIFQSIRFVYSQIILQLPERDTISPTPSTHKKYDGVLLMFYTVPTASIVLLLFSLVEDVPKLIEKIPTFYEEWYLSMVIIGLFMGCIALGLTVGQFKTVEYFSSIALTVAAKIREIVLLFLSLLIFGDKWNVFTIIGYSVVAFGVIIYNTYKIGSVWKKRSRGDSRNMNGDASENINSSELKFIENVAHEFNVSDTENDVYLNDLIENNPQRDGNGNNDNINDTRVISEVVEGDIADNDGKTVIDIGKEKIGVVGKGEE